MIDNSKQLSQMIAQLVEDKKAQNIVVIEMESHSALCDYQVVATVTNIRQAQTIADFVVEKICEYTQIKPSGVEGLEEGHWVFIDFGTVLVHLMNEESRLYYKLEDLWKKPFSGELKANIPREYKGQITLL